MSSVFRSAIIALAAAILLACEASQPIYGYLWKGDVFGSNLYGSEQPSDLLDDVTFSQAGVTVLAAPGDTLLVSVASTKNVAIILELHCDGTGGPCEGSTKQGSLRAGLFRMAAPPGEVVIFEPIERCYAAGGADALFGDARCLPLVGSARVELVDADDEDDRVKRVEVSLQSLTPAPLVEVGSRFGSDASWLPARRSRDPVLPAQIRGEFRRYRQRIDPGGALL